MSMNEQTLAENRLRQPPLKGRRVAILATDGFEPSELEAPRAALEDAGASTHVLSPDAGTIRGWGHEGWGKAVRVDRALADADPDDYDALVLPGGVINPDRLRLDPRAVRFVRAFFEAEKPVAAICHGPIVLIEADVVRDRRLTSWPSIATDLRNAGARWVDEEVVVDRNLVTSRRPDDLPAFSRRTIAEFGRASVAARTDRTMEA